MQIESVDRTAISDVELNEETLDPGMHYRFCAPRNFARRRAQGYEPVLRSVSGVRLMHEEKGHTSTDDLIHRGDAILMACDKKVYRERRKRIDEITRLRLGAPERKFKEKAQKAGVKVKTSPQEKEEPE